jgi:replicative DNA helicase
MMTGQNGNGRTAQSNDIMVPHSVEAEETVLGSILLNEQAWFEVADILSPDDFFIVRNGWVYEAMQRLKRRGEHIDEITLADELRVMPDGSSSKLDGIGGKTYLWFLINNTPSTLYLETYARIVERAAIRRRLLEAASEIARAAHEESDSIEATIADAEQAFFAGVQRRSRRSSVHISDALTAHTNDLERRAALVQEGKLTGIPTGLTELDQLLGGLQRSNYIILAGRPGMGKTSLMLTILLNAARLGVRVGMLSLEMSVDRLTRRLVAMETSISTTQQRSGKLTDDEWSRYYEAESRLAKLPIYLDHTPSMSPDAMRSVAHRFYGEYGIQLLMVDYIGLMSIPGFDPKARTSLITECSARAVQTCHELDIPLIMASQLNRDVENRADKRPAMSDLRDSGALEQDADVILMLYRDEEYNEATEFPNQADVFIRKHRDGATGMVSLYFRKELTQFADLKKTHVDFRGYGDSETNTKTKSEAARQPSRKHWSEKAYGDPKPLEDMKGY